MTTRPDRKGWKCPACGDLDGKHITGCRFSPPFDTDDDIRRYYEAQRLALAGHSESVSEYVQRVKGEPYRPDPSPDYVVIVQVISLHQRGAGLKPEWIDETEPAEVERYKRLPDALKHAEKLSEMIRLIGACDRCSGSGELTLSLLEALGDPAPTITCPDCNGQGRG